MAHESYGDSACCGWVRAAAFAARLLRWSKPVMFPASLIDVGAAFACQSLHWLRRGAQHGLAGGSSSGVGDCMVHRTAAMFIALAPAAERVLRGHA